MALYIHKRVTKWGNGYGIRLTKKEVERLQVAEGDEIEGELFGEDDYPTKADLDRLAVFHLGGYDTQDLDDLAGDQGIEDLARGYADDDS